MDYSDPYDDDGFFDNPDALLAIAAAEAQAVSASQAIATKQPPRYHHTVSAPRGASSAAPFGRHRDGTPKDPAPLNIQPGSVAGGFGWEAGGKRVAEGNVARHLQAVEDRQSYWAKGRKEDDDQPMDFMVDDTGFYAHGTTNQDEEDVVDNRHLPINITATQAPPRLPPDPKSAQARRQAIEAALGANGAQDGKRAFSRSVSTSHLLPSRLDPAPSQSGSQPSSQGAAVRKLHLDLAEREKRVQELERQLSHSRKAGNDRPLWRDEMDVDVDHDEGERKRTFNALQMKVYEAEGKAATMERNKQKDISRYAAEADKLKTEIDALQSQMQAKEREYKQQLESLKSQAVFNNHAVMNSVARGRQSSQRPHSPKVFSDTKSKLAKPPPPQPGFKNLVNAFSGPSRVKRQRTQEPSPLKVEPCTPEASPVKPKPEVEVLVEVIDPPDKKAELLHHLFSYTYVSSLRQQGNTQPTLFHILNYQSNNLIDPTHEYPQSCANLLKSSGDSDLDFDGMINEVAVCFVRMLGVFERSLSGQTVTELDAFVICDVFRMLSRTAIIFPTLVDAMLVAEPQLGGKLYQLARYIRGPRLVDPAKSELSALLADVGEAMCCEGNGRAIWHSTELVNLILLFAGNARAVDLFFAASCSTSHFNALTAGTPEGGQPLLDAMARMLAVPHSKSSVEVYRNSMIIIRAFSMLAVSDPNGVLLVSERTVLVPCLVKVLHRESTRIWGINYEKSSLKDPLSLLHLALNLLHHLGYPSPYAKNAWSSSLGEVAIASRMRLLSATSDPEPATEDLPQGINIGDRLLAATHTKEFNGIHHIFQSTLGAMAFAEVDLEGVQGDPHTWRVSADDLRRIQYLSQDLLEAVAEGPEVDAIYEIYAGEDDDADEGVDPEVYAEMDNIQVVD